MQSAGGDVEAALRPAGRCPAPACRARPRRRRQARGSAISSARARDALRARSRRVDVATARGMRTRLEPVEQRDASPASPRCLRARRSRRTAVAMPASAHRPDSRRRDARARIAAQSRKLRPIIDEQPARVELDAERRRGLGPCSARRCGPVSSMQAVHVEDHGARQARGRGARIRRAGRGASDNPPCADRASPCAACACAIAQASASAASGDGAPRSVEQPADHVLHLLLRRLAMADDRLLHLQRRVFGDRAGWRAPRRRSRRRAPVPAAASTAD